MNKEDMTQNRFFDGHKTNDEVCENKHFIFKFKHEENINSNTNNISNNLTKNNSAEHALKSDSYDSDSSCSNATVSAVGDNVTKLAADCSKPEAGNQQETYTKAVLKVVTTSVEDSPINELRNHAKQAICDVNDISMSGDDSNCNCPYSDIVYVRTASNSQTNDNQASDSKVDDNQADDSQADDSQADESTYLLQKKMMR